MSTTPTSHDLDHALRLILEMQRDAATACAYLGDDETEIRADLEGLDQDWRKTLRVSRDAGGAVDGAALIEWDEDLDRSWVHGPWTRTGRWEQQAPSLLQTVIAQAPVGRHEIYAGIENTQMAWLAERCGWAAGEANFEYEKPVGVEGSARSAPHGRVRLATAQDLPAISALHDAEFPGTYASSADLLEGQSSNTTFVREDDGRILGYLSCQTQGESTLYVDFLAVAPDARRRGVARALLEAVPEQMGAALVTLTVDENRGDALRFYEALGFTRAAATRPYRLRADT
jgi:ribosomal protein S18 acetylase RimI-like enzyme